MTTTNQAKFLDTNPVQRGLVGRFHRTFVRELKRVNPVSVLEVGCGEGYLLHQIDTAFPQVPKRGLDISDHAIDEGHRLFSALDLRHGDIYHLPEADQSWDVIIASEVLEHLEDPAAALRELRRVSKRIVMLSVPHEPWFQLGNFGRGRHLARFGNHPEHINRWTKRRFEKFVRAIVPQTHVASSFPWTIIVGQK